MTIAQESSFRAAMSQGSYVLAMSLLHDEEPVEALELLADTLHRYNLEIGPELDTLLSRAAEIAECVPVGNRVKKACPDVATCAYTPKTIMHVWRASGVAQRYGLPPEDEEPDRRFWDLFARFTPDFDEDEFCRFPVWVTDRKIALMDAALRYGGRTGTTGILWHGTIEAGQIIASNELACEVVHHGRVTLDQRNPHVYQGETFGIIGKPNVYQKMRYFGRFTDRKVEIPPVEWNKARWHWLHNIVPEYGRHVTELARRGVWHASY